MAYPSLLLLALISGPAQSSDSCPHHEVEEGTQSCGTALLQSMRHHSQKSAVSGSQRKQYATMEQQVARVDDDGVAVIVPGLGGEERAAQVAQNLEWLRMQNVPFDCWIYIYRSEEEFPLDVSDPRFEPCQLIRHPGYWMSHMLELPLNATTKPWVLHMMDGIEPQADVNLAHMLKVMAANGLGHAAPTFDTQKHPNEYVDNVYPIMARRGENSIGRFVDFIELQFDVFSREYFACLQDLIDTENFLGWGMDRIMPAVCGGAASGSEREVGRMGLLDQMEMVKKLHASYDLSAADQAGKVYLEKHSSILGPQYVSLGELAAPPEA